MKRRVIVEHTCDLCGAVIEPTYGKIFGNEYYKGERYLKLSVRTDRRHRRYEGDSHIEREMELCLTCANRLIGFVRSWEEERRSIRSITNKEMGNDRMSRYSDDVRQM